MEAHNSKTRLGTSEVPLVVKFADAKRKEPSPHHVSPLAILYGRQRTLYRLLFNGPTGDSWTSV